MFTFQIEKDGQLISPFHDIPLYADSNHNVVNMVVEIPRWTNAKVEASTFYTINDNNSHSVDFYWREIQPAQTRRKEGKAKICAQLFPIQRIYLELWCLTTGNCKQ